MDLLIEVWARFRLDFDKTTRQPPSGAQLRPKPVQIWMSAPALRAEEGRAGILLYNVGTQKPFQNIELIIRLEARERRNNGGGREETHLGENLIFVSYNHIRGL